MLLFVYWKTRNLPVMHRRPLFITVEKTNTGFCIPNNLFTSMKKKKGPIVFCKTITNCWRQTTWNIVQWKKFSNHSFCSHCSGEAKPQDKVRASFSQCLIAALLKNTQCQHHCLSSPDSHKSSGLLFDKLESQFGYAAWANYTHYCKFRQRIKSDIHPVLLSFIFENVTVKTLVSAQDLQTFINIFV